MKQKRGNLKMKVLNMLNWLNCSFQGHKWHQLDVALQGKQAYKCERCGMLKNDKAFKHTFEILLPKQFTGSCMGDDIKH